MKYIKYCLVIAVVVINSKYSFSQIPSGGVEIITNTFSQNSIWDEKNGSKTIVAITGQPFTEALRLETKIRPPYPWEFMLGFNSRGAGITTGDVILVAFYARTIQTIQETGEGLVNVVIENNKDFTTKVMSQAVNIGSNWTQYFVKVVANQTLWPENVGAAFQLGFPRQTVEFADIKFINYKNLYTLVELPETKLTYVGMEPNAAWRSEADLRIEQIRKGNIKLKLVDNVGKAVPNVTVKLTMKRHHFPFGSAVDVTKFQSNTSYKDSIFKLFNQVVFENDLKWFYIWNREKTLQAIKLLNDNKISVRGHVLVWPSFYNSPTSLANYKNDTAALRREINKHIDDQASTFKGQLIDWDVINEPYDNFDFMNILGYPEMAQWFKRAMANDPNAKLFINDYSILSNGGIDVAHQNHYFKTIKYIDSLGAPIQGVGMQGHFGNQLTPLVKVYEILNRFATLKKDIKISEFDIDVLDEDIQGRYTKDFMTMVFSHPSVKGFLMWGFWEGQHWKPKAAMYRNDWSIKPNGLAYKDLVFNKWWTPAIEVKSDMNGEINTRGFLGDYEYVLKSDKGEIRSSMQVFNNGMNEKVIEVDASFLTGIKKLPGASTEQINIYPQPFNDSFELLLEKNFASEISIISQEGIILEKMENVFVKNVILGKNLKPGSYILRIKADGEIKSFGIIKI